MRVSTTLGSILPALAAANLFKYSAHSANSTPNTTAEHSLVSPQMVTERAWSGFELRQEIGGALALPDGVRSATTLKISTSVLASVALPDNPLLPINLALPAKPTEAVSSVTSTISNAPAIPAAPPIGPVIPVTVSSIITPILTPNLLASTSTAEDSATTQWIETWIGGTSQTWVPKTIVFHYPTMSRAPLPGKGQIGMGTLTGDTGKTQTVMGAAPSQTVHLIRGVAVAIGIGVAGLVR